MPIWPFDASLLTMLGVKTTCKDRWRQVLAEARRIERKHLLTLETAISGHQTDEMRDNHLQLVVPRGPHGTFSASSSNGCSTWRASRNWCATAGAGQGSPKPYG